MVFKTHLLQLTNETMLGQSTLNNSNKAIRNVQKVVQQVSHRCICVQEDTKCLLAYPLQALHELPAIALADLGDLQVLGGLHILAVLLLHLEVILLVSSDLGTLGNELPAVVLGDLQILGDLKVLGSLADLGDLQVLGGLHILAVLLLHLEVILLVSSDLGTLGNELPAVVLGDLQILGDLKVLGSLADLGDLQVLTLELLYSEQFKVIHGLALVEGDWMARGVNSALLVGEI